MINESEDLEAIKTIKTSPGFVRNFGTVPLSDSNVKYVTPLHKTLCSRDVKIST